MAVLPVGFPTFPHKSNQKGGFLPEDKALGKLSARLGGGCSSWILGSWDLTRRLASDVKNIQNPKLTNGCGSKMGTKNGTLANGKVD